MATPRPRVKVPSKAAPGEIVEIKTLISHTMESGQRKDKEGNIIPRMIINKFTCSFNGKPVFSCDMLPAIAANPYMQFSAKVEESGTFEFRWDEDGGEVYTTTSDITVG